MGSSSLSTSGANKYGKWRDLYDYEKCEHDKEQKEVKIVRWISVPMTNNFIYLWITSARLFTYFFNREIEEKLKRKNLTHDCVEALIKCKVCGKISFYTLEYSSSGREIHSGRYKIYQKIDGVYEYEPENMNLKDLYDIFHNVWHNISGKDYNIFSRNCKDYAKSICHYLKKAFYEIDEKKRNNGFTFDVKSNIDISFNLFFIINKI